MIKRTPNLDKPAHYLLTVAEAALYMGVSKRTVYDAYQRRGMSYLKISHRIVRFRREWLDEWLEEQGGQAGRALRLAR